MTRRRACSAAVATLRSSIFDGAHPAHPAVRQALRTQNFPLPLAAWRAPAPRIRPGRRRTRPGRGGPPEGGSGGELGSRGRRERAAASPISPRPCQENAAEPVHLNSKELQRLPAISRRFSDRFRPSREHDSGRRPAHSPPAPWQFPMRSDGYASRADRDPVFARPAEGSEARGEGAPHPQAYGLIAIFPERRRSGVPEGGDSTAASDPNRGAFVVLARRGDRPPDFRRAASRHRARPRVVGHRWWWF